MKKDIREEEQEVRLNKFISHNTIYSRREADKIIEEGRVIINKEVVNDMGRKVKNSDIVLVDNKAVKEDKDKMITVIVYNKQKGELVTKKDPRDRKVIFDTLEHKFKHFMPVGRLDYASEGVLLLSDSVDTVTKLMNSDLERTYKIKLNGPITDAMERAMREGLELEDATIGGHANSKIKSMTFKPFNRYTILTNTEKFSKLKVVISEGKNRELRRFFGHFNIDVMDLKRLDFGGVSLNNLPSGKSRYLTREEYKNLRYFLNENE